MSTPAGQSAEHPLQERHRSTASLISPARQPVTSDPFASSCSTRARPLVESFSSLVARNDGHITPPLDVVSARHLPTPTQRCTAALKSPSSDSYANPRRCRNGLAAG